MVGSESTLMVLLVVVPDAESAATTMLLPVLVTGRVSVESAMVKLRIGAMTLPAVLVSTNVPPFM